MKLNKAFIKREKKALSFKIQQCEDAIDYNEALKIRSIISMSLFNRIKNELKAEIKKTYGHLLYYNNLEKEKA
jgi:hypothetical protein